MTRITDSCRIVLVFAFAAPAACGGSQDKGVKNQELTDQPRPAGAESGANGELLMA